MSAQTEERLVLDYKAPKVGKQKGANRDMIVYFRVKPGHEQQASDDLRAFGPLLDKYGQPLKLGLHESKLAMLENNTRLMFCTTFDPEPDIYIDDAIARLTKALHMWMRHCEGYPGTMDAPPTDLSKLKEWWFTNWVTSDVFYRPYPVTVHEIVKALRVNEAFQKVLDDPNAGTALQNPALKPLLDLASA